MSKKILLVMMCVVLLFSITGCGNTTKTKEQKEENKKDIVMTCTVNSKPENDYEATTTTTEIFTYDNNMILKEIKIINKEEYSSEERANSQKNIQEEAVNRANEIEGIIGTIEVKSNTSFIYSFTYDLEKINNLEDILGSEASIYLNYSTHKFDVDKYVDSFIDNNNNELSNGTCTMEQF